MTPFARLWPALAALAVVGVGVVAIGFGAYEPAGSAEYAVGDALRFGVYHAADLLLLVGVVPACAVAALALARPDSPEVRAYLAVTLAFAAGFVGEVGLFASRYVGRLAERDLLGLAPLFFLGLCLWLDRGAPRRRASSYVVAFAAAALVLALPLGRLVHEAALPDAFTLIPVWQLGSYDVVVWSFTAVAVLAFALLPQRLLVAIPVALALRLRRRCRSPCRGTSRTKRRLLETAFFGESDPEWVDAAAQGDVAYFYDGEASLERGLVARLLEPEDPQGLRARERRERVPGPMPQQRVEPFPLGELAADSPAWVVGATPTFTFPGEPVATITQVGLGQNGLTLWRSESPLRLQTRARRRAGQRRHLRACVDDRLRLSRRDVRADADREGLPGHGAARQRPRRRRSGRWPPRRSGARPSRPSARRASARSTIAPSGIVGSTRFEYVPGF